MVDPLNSYSAAAARHKANDSDLPSLQSPPAAVQDRISRLLRVMLCYHDQETGGSVVHTISERLMSALAIRITIKFRFTEMPWIFLPIFGLCKII